jgi:ribosomal-protein-alanine N-acetyltransferase
MRNRNKSGGGLLVGPLGKNGFRDILSVETAGQRKRWTDGMLKSELSHEHGFHFLARAPEERRPCAFILCRLYAGELHIHRLCTTPSRRRMGYATALLTHVLSAARKRGAGLAFLEVSASNGTALSLYRRLGFTVEAERKKYYPDSSDAVVMSRGL